MTMLIESPVTVHPETFSSAFISNLIEAHISDPSAVGCRELRLLVTNALVAGATEALNQRDSTETQPPVQRGMTTVIGVVTRRTGKAPCTGRQQAQADARYAAYDSGNPDVVKARVRADLTSILRRAARPVHCEGSWKVVGVRADRRPSTVNCPACGAAVSMMFGTIGRHDRPATVAERAATELRELDHLSSLYPAFALAVAEGVQ